MTNALPGATPAVGTCWCTMLPPSCEPSLGGQAQPCLFSCSGCTPIPTLAQAHAPQCVAWTLCSGCTPIPTLAQGQAQAPECVAWTLCSGCTPIPTLAQGHAQAPECVAWTLCSGCTPIPTLAQAQAQPCLLTVCSGCTPIPTLAQGQAQPCVLTCSGCTPIPTFAQGPPTETLSALKAELQAALDQVESASRAAAESQQPQTVEEVDAREKELNSQLEALRARRSDLESRGGTE